MWSAESASMKSRATKCGGKVNNLIEQNGVGNVRKLIQAGGENICLLTIMKTFVAKTAMKHHLNTSDK